MARFSKQREAILSAVRSVCTHPTAYDIYGMVRKEIPNISLGTVYRNLAYLSDEGLITAIKMEDGNVRYDGTVHSHLHLTCKICGSIEDVCIESKLPYMKKLAEQSEFSVDHGVYVLYGICKNCQKQ